MSDNFSSIASSSSIFTPWLAAIFFRDIGEIITEGRAPSKINWSEIGRDGNLQHQSLQAPDEMERGPPCDQRGTSRSCASSQ
jgi:hypothetical protein